MNQDTDVTRRLIGSSAISVQVPGESDIGVTLDVSGFVRRLLLFDTYILYSVRLKEIPELVRKFGFSGTMALLSSGALEIRCECAQMAEGNFGSTPACPLFTYQFQTIEAHIWEQYLIDSLPEVAKSPGLTSRELYELRSAVVKAVKRGDNRQMFSQDVGPAFESEVLHNEPLAKTAVLFVLSKFQGVTGVDDFYLKFQKVGDDRYRAETNLGEKLSSLSTDKLNASIKSGLLGIAGMCQRIGEMKMHSALSGFAEEEVLLLRTKFSSMATMLESKKEEEQFQRVMSLHGLDDVSPRQTVDIERLLEIRSSPEGREFRTWLRDIERLSDAEIKERVRSLNARIGLIADTTAGQVLRFLVTNAVGLHSAIEGIALGALDAFLIQNFFKRSGPAAFVNKLYPSVFRQ